MKEDKLIQATSILGVPVANLDYGRATDKIMAWARKRRNRSVSICNVHSITSSLWTPKLREALLSSDLCTADGAPLVWTQRLMGSRDSRRVYGPTLMLKTLEKLNAEGLSTAFYGGHPDRLKKLVEFVARRYPKIKITAAISPPFRKLTLKEKLLHLDELRAGRPHVTWVGIGCPKQEQWINEHSPLLSSVLIGVGAAFDFHAGAIRQAPPQLQALGLEWAFRLCCEPRRLFWRYLSTNPVFALLAALQVAGRLALGQNYLREIPPLPSRSPACLVAQPASAA